MIEKNEAVHDAMHEDLERGLEERHIQLMALGGAIGVGLFLGSASAIKTAGPSLLLAYAIGGFILFIIVRALGVMAVEHPISGSFSAYAYEFIGPLAGYLTGWTYWFTWVVTCMAETTAVGVYINFWFPGVPQWQAHRPPAVRGFERPPASGRFPRCGTVSPSPPETDPTRPHPQRSPGRAHTLESRKRKTPAWRTHGRAAVPHGLEGTRWRTCAEPFRRSHPRPQCYEHSRGTPPGG